MVDFVVCPSCGGGHWRWGLGVINCRERERERERERFKKRENVKGRKIIYA